MDTQVTLHTADLAPAALILSATSQILTLSLKNPSKFKCRAIACSCTPLTQVKHPGDTSSHTGWNQQVSAGRGSQWSENREFIRHWYLKGWISALCLFFSVWHSRDQEMKLYCMLLEVKVFRGMSLPVSPSLKRSRARIRVGYWSRWSACWINYFIFFFIKTVAQLQLGSCTSSFPLQ